jgi:hypothetical protein
VADLLRLLAEGKTYLWALRQSQHENMTPELAAELRDRFAADGIDASTLAALRQLEYPIARFARPVAKRIRHGEYLYFQISAFDIEIYFNELITEHGLELGVELFPSRVEWTFAHPEIQYCIGGDTRWHFVNPDGSKRTAMLSPGDVGVYPTGTSWICESNERPGVYGHAHIFLLNIGEQEGQLFYDFAGVLRLQALGIIPAESPPELLDLERRIEVTDLSRLVDPQPGRERDLPTWLRNGWARRVETRALDYAEGAGRLVLSSPDRTPSDYLEWDAGPRRCYVNPLIAEPTAAVTDCRLPAGFRRPFEKRELWVVLSGAAKVRQSVPVFHAEWVEHDLESGWVMAVGAGSHVHVDDASDDFVVRRLAETCGHNGHVRMMERKLEFDGVASEL